MSNDEGALRCGECGRVDAPRMVGPGPGWLALLLWAAVGAIWGVGYILAATWLFFLAAILFLGAFIYTLWYFFRREQACRHCGARNLAPRT